MRDRPTKTKPNLFTPIEVDPHACYHDADRHWG
jgi:hypothetical protein